MEYLLGSIVTLITMSIVAKLVRHPKNAVKNIKTNFNQSRQHELVRDFLPFQRKKLKTQATKNHNARRIRVIFIDEDAYWIEKNALHTARLSSNGQIDESSKIKVDIMAMDKVELDKMIFIVNKLTEGLSDDSGNSGH